MLLAERQDNFSVTSAPKVLMQLKSIGIGKFSICYLYRHRPKLSGIQKYKKNPV